MSDHAARLTVDTGALRRNYRRLAEMSGPAECAAVVKADGYGLGQAEIGRALHDEGARTFFVAHLSEGEALRATLPRAVIYVLNGVPPGAAHRLAAARLRPVIGASDELREWAEHGSRTGHGSCTGHGPYALHVDTGMNRLGLPRDEANALANAGAPEGLALVMSHLACADDAAAPSTALQAARFAEIAPCFAGVPASLANSAGVLRGGLAHDLTRPGIALYGASALTTPSALETVATLEAPVLQVRNVAAGETVGYGATWTARRASRIAIVSCGYADGFIRAAGSSDAAPGHAGWFKGSRPPLAGRVSMDLIALDVTDAPACSRGDLIELLGPNATLDAAAKAAGTIGYEFLTGLGRRFARRYV